uniref:Uncharacterized protein n=1 Tax=viral metagenome TaxID=1070528 RepID=A0A6H2A403_9ZZZZ
MTELKTLENLKKDEITGTLWRIKYSEKRDVAELPVVLVEDLRAEAIKWIRHLRTELCKNSHNCDHCADIFGTIGWIKIFFNISEEELS